MSGQLLRFGSGTDKQQVKPITGSPELPGVVHVFIAVGTSSVDPPPAQTRYSGFWIILDPA